MGRGNRGEGEWEEATGGRENGKRQQGGGRMGRGNRGEGEWEEATGGRENGKRQQGGGRMGRGNRGEGEWEEATGERENGVLLHILDILPTGANSLTNYKILPLSSINRF